MAMSGAAYWAQRSVARMDKYLRDSDDTLAIIGKAHAQAERDIQAEIDAIYARYEKVYRLDPQKAREMLLQPAGQAEYEKLVQQIAGIKNPVIRRQLAAQASSGAYAYRISRLEVLKSHVRAQTARLADVELGATMSGLTRTITDAYSRSMFDLQRGTGYGFSFARMNTQTVDEILSNPWSGSTFSARIWQAQDVLAKQLNEKLTAGFMSGKSNAQLSRDLADTMGVSYRNAERLVRTETNYMANAAEMKSYTEAGIDEYEYMATLDKRTSEICQELDGQVFKVKEAKPGKNMPPMHPFCRSTTVAALTSANDAALQRRARNPVTGEPMLVPGDMKYKEWEEWQKAGAQNSVAGWRKGQTFQVPGASSPNPAWATWRRKAIAGTADDDIKAVNPNYASGMREYRLNCQRCVPAYEMRRRGYDVTAKPRILSGPDAASSGWKNIFENPQWIRCTAGTGIQQVKKEMAAFGDGARAEVYVVWSLSGSAHVFVAEQRGAKTVFLDPQSGDLDVLKYFAWVKKGSTQICRIDTLNPSKLIDECCEVK